MKEKNYESLINLISSKDSSLEEYIRSYLLIKLNNEPVKSFISFNLIDDSDNIAKTLFFSDNSKKEYLKVLWKVVSGKDRYEDYKIELFITEDIIRHLSEGLLEFYRNDNEIINKIIDLLRLEKFDSLLKESAEKFNINKNLEALKDIYAMFGDRESDTELQTLENIQKLLEISLKSNDISEYIYDTLRDTELVKEIRWELRKYLYSAMGITAGGALFFAFLPVLVVGILVGTFAFKSTIVKLISKGTSEKLVSNIKVTNQAIFGSINFQKILADEIISNIKTDSPVAELESSSNDSAVEESSVKKDMLFNTEVLKVSNIFAYMKVLSAVMWADGVLQAEELDFWKKITTLDLGLSEKQSKEIESWLEEGPKLDIIGSEITDPDEQHFVLRQAMIMSMIDGEVDERELKIIRHLADEFDVSDSLLEDIESEAKDLLNINY